MQKKQNSSLSVKQIVNVCQSINAMQLYDYDNIINLFQKEFKVIGFMLEIVLPGECKPFVQTSRQEIPFRLCSVTLGCLSDI